MASIEERIVGQSALEARLEEAFGLGAGRQ